MKVPMKLQIGTVVLLFVASLATLWSTSASVVAREGRRASAGIILSNAGIELAERGKTLLAEIPGEFDQLSREEWEALDHKLVGESMKTLAIFDGVEGGYFLRNQKQFLGASFPTEPARVKAKAKVGNRGPHGPPPREVDLIEIQADAAIRLNRDLLVVEVVPPSTVAIRTAPVVVEGRAVAATWTMTRLVDPLFLDRSLQGYRLAAGLALGGIALALALTMGLARTVGRQASERDRLQAELRRSERLAALGKMLAGVAHEIRNPLAGIRSTVQLWERGIGPDEESFGDLLSEVDRIEGIVERLLHFSRAEHQNLVEGDLNDVVLEAARLARATADSQGVEIVLDLDPKLPEVSMAPASMIQVFRNLTTNALQMMPIGGEIRLATRLDSTRKLVEVHVSDTGPGLNGPTIAHLFEPFYTTRAGGTGLGLAIAREIILAHRGDLRAANRHDGPGAIFTLTLPAFMGDPR